MKKALSILLAFIMATVLLAGCNDKSSSESIASSDLSDEDSNIIDTEEKLDLPDKDWGGVTLTALSVDTDRHSYGTVQFAPVEELETNIINDTVDTRNKLIEEKYGIKIETYSMLYPKDEVPVIVQTNNSDYDFICDGVTWMAQHVLSDYFWCLDDLDNGNGENYINLDKSWWDQRCNENLSLLGRHFLIAGDLIITDDDYTYCTIYSKTLAEENSIDNLYDLVNNGEWTLDKYLELALKVRVADENGLYSVDATWGSLAHNYASTIMINGSGISLVEKDGEGLPVIGINTEKANYVFNKVFALLGDKQVSILADGIEGNWGTTSNIFLDNRGLFYNTTVADLTNLRKSDEKLQIEYGVLPIPKADEDQDKYYNAVNVYQSSVIGIPKSNVENYEVTTFALEALGYYSKYAKMNLNDAYFKTTLNLQSLDDSRDVEMLDIILSSRIYDIGAIYNFGGIIGLPSSSVSKGENTLASDLDSIESAVNQAIETALYKYAEMN